MTIEQSQVMDIISNTKALDNLERLHQKAERRRLDGRKPTRAQIRYAKRMVKITPMASARVIDEITAEMMPETNDITYFLGVK